MLSNEQILKLSHSLVYQSNFLEFYAENPFQFPVFWQITWNNHSIMVYKSTFLKYISDQNNSATWEISREEGTLNYHDFLEVFNVLRKENLPPYFDCATYGRDGHFYKLTLGDNSTSITYRWYEAFVPDSWHTINQNIDKLKRLLENWEANTKNSFRIAYTEQETQKGFLTLMDFSNSD